MADAWKFAPVMPFAHRLIEKSAENQRNEPERKWPQPSPDAAAHIGIDRIDESFVIEPGPVLMKIEGKDFGRRRVFELHAILRRIGEFDGTPARIKRKRAQNSQYRENARRLVQTPDQNARQDVDDEVE